MTKTRLIEYINNRLDLMTEKQLRLVLSFIRGFNYINAETERETNDEHETPGRSPKAV